MTSLLSNLSHPFTMLMFSLRFTLLLLRSFLPFTRRPIWLLDLQVADDLPASWSVDSARFRSILTQWFGASDAVEFQCKMMDKSGIGGQASWPPHITDGRTQLDDRSGREEFSRVVFPCIERALARTGLKPKQIDILVVNCTIFNPTPSLAAMVINKFGMRHDIKSYNLGGMGCSASLIGVELIADIMQTHPGSRALLVSTEVMSPYTGQLEREMMMQNALFRCGAAAVVLSSSLLDGARGSSYARYQLKHTVRTCLAADEKAYRAVYQDTDAEGNRGVRIQKELLEAAGKAVKINLTAMAPKALSYTELARYALHAIRNNKFMKRKSSPAQKSGSAGASEIGRQQDRLHRSTFSGRLLPWVAIAATILICAISLVGLKSVQILAASLIAKIGLHPQFSLAIFASVPIALLSVQLSLKPKLDAEESSAENEATSAGSAGHLTVEATGSSPSSNPSLSTSSDTPSLEKRDSSSSTFQPNFKSGIDYFCIHAGGRAVIDGLQKSLRLSDSDVECSRAVLQRFGNTSSSSVWYELHWLEQNRYMRAGQRIMQLALGSGFKCNTALWEKM